MIVFLFGLPGVGKTYIGQLMEKELGVHYWDGDEALTDEMKLAVQNEQPFSRTMTAQLTSTLINKIKELSQEHRFVIVSQAMLRESDRKLFLEQFSDLHFIYVRCDPDQTSQRIAQRADFVTVSYLEKLIIAFEPHRKEAESYPTIDNYQKNDEQLIKDFSDLLSIKSKVAWKPDFFAELLQQGKEVVYPDSPVFNKAY